MNLRRAAGLAALLPLGFLFLGVVVLVTFTRGYQLWAATDTPDERLQPLRWRIAWSVLKAFGIAAAPMHARALTTILANELPARWEPGTPVVGDETFAAGPSIGPGQVYRATATELGLWSPPEGASEEEARAAYRELAAEESRMLEWSAAVLRAKWDAAESAAGEGASDEDIAADAVRRYNGGGAAARAYRDRAVAHADAWWGGYTV